MQQADKDALVQQLNTLRALHQKLSEEIVLLSRAANADRFEVLRLKREKVQLKDRISVLEDKITPDIIA